MTTTRSAALGALLLAVLSTPAAAQQGAAGGDFSWSEAVPQGAWLRVLNHHGTVEVRQGTGSRPEVTARRISSRGGDREVRFQVLRDADGVTICAMPEDATCTAQGIRTREHWGRDEEARVAFTVLLPRGVRIAASSGNGAVSVQDAGAEVSASSGNGDVRVTRAAAAVRASSGNGAVEVSESRGPVRASTGNGRVTIGAAEGPVNASSGNGSIDVTVASLRQLQDMQFTTGNGSVRVRLPADFQGEIDASTGHGGISTDFPLTVEGRMNPSRLHGTIGRGGPRIRMSSGNGSLELRRLD